MPLLDFEALAASVNVIDATVCRIDDIISGKLVDNNSVANHLNNIGSKLFRMDGILAGNIEEKHGVFCRIEALEDNVAALDRKCDKILAILSQGVSV